MNNAKRKPISKEASLKIAGFITLVVLAICIILLLKGFGGEAFGWFMGFFFGLIAMYNSFVGQGR